MRGMHQRIVQAVGAGDGIYTALRVLRILVPVILLLAVVAAGGWYLASIDAEPWTMFALVAIAMVIYGVATALAVRAAAWGRPA